MTWRALLEILILFLCIYGLLRFLRGTRGGRVIQGLFIFILAAFILVNGVFKLVAWPHLEYVFQNLITLAAIFMIVIFQPEIRRGLMRLGEKPFIGQLLRTEPGLLAEVMRAVRSLSRGKIGALIAIQREVELRGITEGGVPLDAELKAELLETIFWPGSALHDGGVIVQNGRIAAAGCIFPLTENPQVSRRLGTRHRAAIGITEDTDAVAVVVSEETGAISVAHRGKLYRRIEADDCEQLLRQLLLSRPEAPPSRIATPPTPGGG